SPPPNNPYRKKLEEELLKRRVDNVRGLLDSPDNALVLVTALIPPGCRKGDPLDIDVHLPEGSRVTSLRGGYLELCSLRNYEATTALVPDYQGANVLKEGHVLAHAHGPLLVGLGASDDPSELRRARVWAGGVSHVDRAFTLNLNKDARFAQVANVIA